jgi:hypothetical protein
MRLNKVIALSVLAMTICAPAWAQGITVLVNGSPVAFRSIAPVEMNGSVLVPLRGVFQSMGAHVDYDQATRTITATQGATKVVLPLGQTTAYVDGNPQVLAQPALVEQGATLVPLRFVAEALGAQVQWVEATKTVQISTSGQPESGPPPPMPLHRHHAPQLELQGYISEIDQTAAGLAISVDSADGVHRLDVNGQTTVLSQVNGQQYVTTAPSNLRLGDQVDVTAVDHTALVVKSSFHGSSAYVTGVVRDPQGHQAIRTRQGKIVRLDPNVHVLIHHTEVPVSQIPSGANFTIRVNPKTGLAYELDAP